MRRGVLVLFLVAATIAGPALAQPREFMTPWGRGAVRIPNPVSEGDWDGSWFYADRDRRMGLYIRTSKGSTQVKFQYQSISSPEAFETDWSGRADYFLSGSPVKFRLGITQAGDEEMRGTWEWNAEFPDSARLEQGTFRIYRMDQGRDLVVLFQDWERTVRRFDQESRWDNPPLWVFTKASKRIVLWDELPF